MTEAVRENAATLDSFPSVIRIYEHDRIVLYGDVVDLHRMVTEVPGDPCHDGAYHSMQALRGVSTGLCRLRMDMVFTVMLTPDDTLAKRYVGALKICPFFFTLWT